MFYSFKNAVSGELDSATNPMACIPSPASYAVRPASTACLKAFAISIGLPATAIAVFTRHADAPISIASAAWLGAPIPASTTTGIPACSIMICRNSLDLQSFIGSDRCSQRHYRGGSRFFQLFAKHRICLAIGEHDESEFHQFFSRFQGLHRVGQQIARVGMNLQFQPVGSESLACHLCGKHRFLRVAYARCVGKQLNVQDVQYVSACRLPCSPCRHVFMATVTISVPDASIDCSIHSFELNLPVPRKRRELIHVPQ